MDYTTVESIKDRFYSLIVSGESLPAGLVNVWFESAKGEFELELDKELTESTINQPDGEGGADEIKVIAPKLSSAEKSLLGRYMQKEFITRELSKFAKVTGIDSKDEKVSGLQATKYTLISELNIAETAIAELVSKIKGI